MDGRDQIIDELRELVAELTAKLEQQAARIAELELALAKALKNSSTSSKPPSAERVDETCRKQDRNFFTFLRNPIIAKQIKPQACYMVETVNSYEIDNIPPLKGVTTNGDSGERQPAL